MAQSGVELVDIFQSVTRALAENQQALDQADDRNGDHGTNMVQTFQTITGALQEKQRSSDKDALTYAAQTLAQNTTSGSGQLYAQHLAQAASQVQGKKVDAQGALQLLQTLIGSGQAGQPTAGPAAGGDALGALLGGLAGGQAPAQGTAPAGGADMLGSLLGGLAGGEAPAQGTAPAGGADMLSSLLGGLAGGQAPAQGTAPAGGADMLGSLLGGLAGGEAPAQGTAPAGSADMLGALMGGLAGGQATGAGAQSGLDAGDLLAAGMAFLQAKQGGQGNMQAVVQAFMAGSGMGNTSHRTQSTQLVVNTFLQALGGQK